jgi:hypothetical protein
MLLQSQRSVMRTMSDRLPWVTRTLVPHGSQACAALMPQNWNGRPVQ